MGSPGYISVLFALIIPGGNSKATDVFGTDSAFQVGGIDSPTSLLSLQRGLYSTAPTHCRPTFSRPTMGASISITIILLHADIDVNIHYL